jgi:H+/Cl- antiporter ClcA
MSLGWFHTKSRNPICQQKYRFAHVALAPFTNEISSLRIDKKRLESNAMKTVGSHLRVGMVPWIIRSLLLGAVVGPAITLLTFLVGLATDIRLENPLLLLAIPLGAGATALLYHKLGTHLQNGGDQVIMMINQGIIDIVHPSSIGYQTDQQQHSSDIPQKMAPLLYLNVFISHLVGASAGKEGAGVQIGASIGSYLECFENRFFPSKNTKCRITRKGVWLISGAGAAFSALFGAPVAGTLFGLQFSSPRVNRTDAILPCFLSAWTAWLVSTHLGIATLHPVAVQQFPIDEITMALIGLLAIGFGLMSRLFCYLAHTVRMLLHRWFSNPFARAFASGSALLAVSGVIAYCTGSTEYNGLSCELITEAGLGETETEAPILKMILTVMTIGCGFAGGEIIPLMVIGATAGAAVAPLLSIPFPAMAMFGSIGMLSAATNLPIACFALGLELFGYGHPFSLFLVCAVAYIASGKKGIYEKQMNPISIDETWEV